MKQLSIVLLFILCHLPLSAADLFGNETLDEGEISIAEQIQLYELFFGKSDEAATNSSKKLKLALQLQQDYDNEKFAALRRYILRRIDELCSDNKKKDAIASASLCFFRTL
ncbi:MAG: hypothetical protein HRU15_08540 [Planctomycetes bacterium]|nr:hypothetical protein [Planctomycetota bacterium]